MIASFRAELLKLRKRPATWMLAAIFALAVIFFGYLFTYVFVTNAPEGETQPLGAAEASLQFLLPENFLVNVLYNGFAGFGGALVLILGALVVGSEYGWGTLTAVLTQRPGKLGIFWGKLLALGIVLAVFTLAMLAIGALCSYAFAASEGEPARWPGIGELLRGAGAGWLILVVFAALGVFLATLLRGTALAIGLGLVYLLVLENLFLGLAPQSETIQDIGATLPAKNSLDLSSSFGEIPQIFAAPGGEAAEPAQAALIVAAYAIGFLLLATFVFSRRDVA